MNNEELYILVNCNCCGAYVEILVNENYLTMEKEFVGVCANCNNKVYAK